MKTKDICDLPVQNIAADEGAVLFLWVTMPQLVEGLKVMQAWGFKYRTVAFTWIKRYKSGKPFFGIGFWTKSNAELCLIGTSGKDYPRPIDNHVSQIIETELMKHSKKPDETRDKIVQLMGDLPRIELFARETTPGWDAWGNEIEQ